MSFLIIFAEKFSFPLLPDILIRGNQRKKIGMKKENPILEAVKYRRRN